MGWKQVSMCCISAAVASAAIGHLIELYYARRRACKDEMGSNLSLLPPPVEGVEGLVGNTPMILVKSLSKETGSRVYAKLEYMNPGGSAKDRLALAVIQACAEEQGVTELPPGSTIVEGTSGSTGISLATLCNSFGLHAEIHLPDDTSADKLALLDTLGAKIVKVRPASIVDPDQYVNSARASAASTHNSFFADQFENDCNWRIHYKTTGPEIYKQLAGDVDYFVAGCGTGGTIAGVSKYLKKHLPQITTVLADPQGSGFYNRITHGVMYASEEKEGSRRRHQVDTLVEGIGLNRITHNFAIGEDYIDESIKVSDSEALKMAKYLSMKDGLFIGSSTAINAVAAIKLARRHPIQNKNIVIIACDSGSRHLSKFWKEAIKVPDDIKFSEILDNN